jgi:hypothetical protein
MAKLKTVVYSGMQTMSTGDPTLIPRDNFTDSQNMIRRKDGLWENRKGIKQFGDDVGSGDPIHSLHYWKLEDGTRYLTVGTDTDIYSYAEGSDYNDGSYTNRQTISGATSWDATVYRDTIVLCNGVDTIFTSTDNSTFTSRSGASVTNPRFLDQGNDFVCFTGVTTDPNKFYLSDGAPANPWEFDTNNTLNVDIGNSENVTGTRSLGANIVVTKSNRTYLVDLASLTRTTLDWAGGAESDKALLQTQANEVLCAGRQGIFSIAKTQIGSNQYFGNPESSPIKSLYDTCVDYSSINSVYYPQENYALFTMESSTAGTITLVKNLDFSNPVWTYFTGCNSADWTIYMDSNKDSHLLYGSDSLDKINELLVGRDDNGAPIYSRLAFKNDDFDSPGQYKFVRYIDVSGYISELANWNFELYKDDELIPFKSGVITKEQWQNANEIELSEGLGGAELGGRPLGGLSSDSDDVVVKAFNARINVTENLEKLQVLLYNNQRDVRVVFRAMVVYLEERPLDHYQNDNII